MENKYKCMVCGKEGYLKDLIKDLGKAADGHCVIGDLIEMKGKLFILDKEFEVTLGTGKTSSGEVVDAMQIKAKNGKEDVYVNIDVVEKIKDNAVISNTK